MRINSYSLSSSYYNNNLADKQKAEEHIASGKKVNSAADNVAAVAIIAGMCGQVDGLNQASSNIQDAVSLLSTSEGAMSESTDTLQQMRELSVQASSGILTDEDRSYIQQEMDQLSAQLDTNASNTQFNTINTSDGSLQDFTVQTGANSGQATVISVGDTSATALGISTDVSTQAAAEDSLSAIDSGLQSISSTRSTVGATINCLDSTNNTVAEAAEDLLAAVSSMGDADIAGESNLFQQSGIKAYVSMMALAKTMNQQQGILSLFA